MIKKINQIILILIALIILSCEELSNEPDPTWGCRIPMHVIMIPLQIMMIIPSQIMKMIVFILKAMMSVVMVSY